MVRLDLRTELAQTVLVEFREGETTVASEAAAADTLGQEDLRGAHLGEVDEIVGHTHLSSRTGDVEGDGTVDGVEVETWHEIVHDELCRLVEFHLMHHLFHAVQTGTLGTEHGVLAVFGGLPQRLLQFGTLAVGNVEHTLRLPYLSAAHLLHAFWEDDLVAGLRHELDYLVDQVVDLTALL